MNLYNVILSQNAEIDLQEYIDYIIFECKAPLTALKHYESLFKTLKSLERFPKSYPKQTGDFSCLSAQMFVVLIIKRWLLYIQYILISYTFTGL